ncbi:unnamed protein product [Cuscuta epithymum]|uniref:Uncharacterized protein n=1 Tax=Cuscuta epithymum TaxID=186058 RepID=A0AAV0DBV1_9ASTE|nr:unnamed protein product [Cuscuta epithymum]
MDLKAFTKLSKQLAKERKKKDEGPSTQQHVDAFFKKDKEAEGQVKEGTSKRDAAADADTDAGGSRPEELKRKNTGKGIKPPEKKKKMNGAADKKEAPVFIVEEHPPSELPGGTSEVPWPRESVEFSIAKGTAIMHGTLDPREFLWGATPPTDKSVLSRQKDGALSAKVLQASVTACLGLGELLQRMEQTNCWIIDTHTV